ncbi:MAG: DUF2974 domain-containing protein [Clostridia bacterium]|nr:DUF2974 domain-containing protein [Clostridia bacterium]
MGNMLDYLSWRGDLDLSRVPLCEVDLLVFSRMAYLPMEGQLGEEAQPLGQVMERVVPLMGEGPGQYRPTVKGDYSLAPALRDSPRFASLSLAAFESETDPEQDLQFAAVTVLLPRGIVVCFRGTDGTIVGWKEDFHMSFSDRVVARDKALAYLERVAARFSGPITVVGHSKGGNLALYAAAFCSGEVRRRIKAVRNHDGPGFNDSIASSPRYRSILPKVKTLLPQESVVGLLMEHPEETVVIRSTERALMQHDPFSWVIRRDGFEEVGSLTPGSRFVDAAVKGWVSEMTPEELEKVIDGVFSVLQASDAVDIRDLWVGKNGLAVLRAVRDLSPDVRRMVREAIRFLGVAVKETGKRAGEERKQEKKKELSEHESV